MLEKMTHEDLLRLTSVQDGPCISIYVPALPDKTLQLEYEALVRRAAHLLSFDEKEDQHKGLLEAIYNFNPVEHFASREQGIAVFVNKHWSGYYLAGHDLPSKVVVSETFHLKPLLEDLQNEHIYHALFLSAEESILLHCDGGTGTELHTFLFHQGQHSNSIHWKHLDDSDTISIPHLKSTLRGRGNQDSHFKKKTGVKLFLKWIEAKISKEVGYKTLPLFVFTNEILYHAYKEISSHPDPHLVKIDPAKGTPRMEAIIHYANLEIKKNIAKHKSLSTTEIEELARQKRVIDDLVKISRAALSGKVRTLFLRDNAEIWGQLHRQSGQITFHEKQTNSKDDDILDDIACEVIRQGGEVIVLGKKDMPTPSPAAAILSS
ncbi:hypothetical protein QJS83_16100 [Bdellovibrio sp. 22V]|uniref:baeRF3 domain-containing protein n=1 Tax=Bdellovibrio TaxID=958 RepID=UPI0025431A89|nr:hypothetical protein [Bdellovibrio sp. 22V]WII71986.1 hypothetical protein QJS83_16100 [Bdellovibrio sp. 22V]